MAEQDFSQPSPRNLPRPSQKYQSVSLQAFTNFISTHVYSCLLMSTNVYNRPHEMSYLCRVFRKGASAYTSLCLRSTFVHSSFDLRSSFVRPSFDLRSTFVRPSFGKRKQTKTERRNKKISKNLNPQNLKHNGHAKRYHLKNQHFCGQS